MTKLIPREIKAETKIYFFTLKSLVFMGIWIWLSVILTACVHKSLYLPFLAFSILVGFILQLPSKVLGKKTYQMIYLLITKDRQKYRSEEITQEVVTGE